MTLWSRTDTSPLSRWWWTVDRLSLGAVLVLMSLGLVLVLAASPAIAARHGFGDYHFFYRQVVFVGPALVLMIGLSLLTCDEIRRYAPLALLGFYGLVLLTLLLGSDINGAKRWLQVGPLAVQPSEFLKPFFVLALARVLSEESISRWKRYLISCFMLAAVVLPLTMQPDYGQTALITAVWGAMLFVSGLPVIVMVGLAGLAGVSSVVVYSRVQHVAERINGFLDPSATNSYQVDQALQAFHAGGLTGVGMGEGHIKWHLPDAHTDFIFAVAGEEFGLIFCLIIVALFVTIVFRAFARAMKEPDHFVQIAAAGLAMLLALQAFINLGVNVHVLPAKGMTLPFVSYGGSSLLAVSVTLGLLLALTRRRIRGGLPERIPLKGRIG